LLNVDSEDASPIGLRLLAVEAPGVLSSCPHKTARIQEALAMFDEKYYDVFPEGILYDDIFNALLQDTMEGLCYLWLLPHDYMAFKPLFCRALTLDPPDLSLLTKIVFSCIFMPNSVRMIVDLQKEILRHTEAVCHVLGLLPFLKVAEIVADEELCEIVRCAIATTATFGRKEAFSLLVKKFLNEYSSAPYRVSDPNSICRRLHADTSKEYIVQLSCEPHYIFKKKDSRRRNFTKRGYDHEMDDLSVSLFALYDQDRTVGFDVHLRAAATGLVLIDERNTLASLKQALRRLHGLAKSQAEMEYSLHHG
jgi:hypothetical protein